MSQFLRQGDVLISAIAPDSEEATALGTGEPLPHLTLAEGEVTGHRHRISQGEAKLYESNGVLFLHVLSPTATLTHEEHKPIEIPQGQWLVRKQREYEPEGWRDVAD